MSSYTKNQVNKAGNVLVTQADTEDVSLDEAHQMLTYWRYIHAAVINTFQSSLRTRVAKKYNKTGFIAQRLKRTPSILSKLKRFDTMQLSRMQDIAGIRVVLKKIDDVKTFTDELRHSKWKHQLKSEKDYIVNPKSDGYRGIHLVYEYSNPKIPESQGLKIEVQIRTKLQHVWATALETMDLFMNTAMKSGEGPEELLEFFALTSSAFAMFENSPVCKEHESLSLFDITRRLLELYKKHDLYDKLSAFTLAIKQEPLKGANYQLLDLNMHNKSITITHFKNEDVDEANKEYTELERLYKDDSARYVALVSVDRKNKLKKAFPNYFLDTAEFISKMKAVEYVLKKHDDGTLHELIDTL